MAKLYSDLGKTAKSTSFAAISCSSVCPTVVIQSFPRFLWYELLECVLLTHYRCWFLVPLLFLQLPSRYAELLSDDYVDSHKLKIKSNTASGVSYTVEADQPGTGDGIDGQFSLKFPVSGQSVTTKLYTSGTGTAELSLDELGVKGLSATVLAGIGKEIGVGTVEFKHGPIGFTSSYNTVSRALRASLACAYAPTGYDGFFVLGTDGKVAPSEAAMDDLSFGFSYFDGHESECTMHVTDRGTRGMLSYSHHVRDGLSVASQIAYDKVKDAANLTLGGACRLDGLTVVKGKINSNGQLALSYIQDIRSKTRLILSTKFNVTTLDSARVGISLALE